MLFVVFLVEMDKLVVSGGAEMLETERSAAGIASEKFGVKGMAEGVGTIGRVLNVLIHGTS